MTNLIRQTVVWTGAPGLPGYSQFYQEVTGVIADQAQAGHDALATMFGGLADLVPEEVTLTVDPLYQVLDDHTGALTAEGTVGDPSMPIAGLYVGEWSARMGVLIEWVTVAIINGRHLRGRTYLVPLGAVMATDGTIPEATQTQVNLWAEVLQAGSLHFVVWHRPVNKAGGQISSITGRIVRDHPALLRSRTI